MSDPKWWVAINGGSCAACSVPCKADQLKVIPTPEQLLGFSTREEQMKVHDFLLKAPIDWVTRYMKGDALKKKINRGEIGYVRPSKPQPPLTVTRWLIENQESPNPEMN